MIEDEKLVKQFENRALQQEAWVRLVRYLVGAAVTSVVIASGYSNLTSAIMIVACGILYVGVNVMYDKHLWEKPSE